MNNKAIMLSLGMGLLAMLMVQSYVSSREEETQNKYGTSILVLSAKKDIREMETIDETMLEVRPIPKHFIEPSAIQFKEAGKRKDEASVAKDIRAYAGSVATVPIRKGEQISYNKITEPGLRTGLSPQITPGRRAISLPVNEVTAVGRLLKPGDHVDLLAVMRASEASRVKVAKIVLQDVPVLSVGKNVSNNPARSIETDSGGRERVRNLNQYDGYTNVTVEVEPYQAQMLTLILSDSDNKINLILRNNDDQNLINFNGTTMADVVGSDVNRILNRVPATNGQQR